MHANKLLIMVQPLNQEFSDASVRRKEQKGVLIAGVPCFLSPIASSSLSPTRLDTCYAGYLNPAETA